MYWKKKTNKTTLDDYIRSTSEAEKEMRRVQQKPQKPDKDTSQTDTTPKVKNEPVGKVPRREPSDKTHHQKRKADKPRKPRETHCYRCGDPDWISEHSKICKAWKATCKPCKKSEHSDKMCETKRDKKGKKVDNLDTELSSNDSSTTDNEMTSFSDTNEIVNRIMELRKRDATPLSEQLTIKAIRSHSTRRTRQLKRIGDEFEFMIVLNGRKVAAILDTGSPITILPRKYKPEIKPKRVFGMDSLDKLGLTLMQRRTKPQTNDIRAIAKTSQREPTGNSAQSRQLQTAAEHLSDHRTKTISAPEARGLKNS